MFTLMFYSLSIGASGWTESRVFTYQFPTFPEIYNFLKAFSSYNPIYCFRYEIIPDKEPFYSQAFHLQDLRNINLEDFIFCTTFPDPTSPMNINPITIET